MGAEYHECVLGTDCDDCGPAIRVASPPGAILPPASPSLPPYTCLLDVLRNLRELPVPRSCVALSHGECELWRMNSRRCKWVSIDAGDGSDQQHGACKAGEPLNCHVSPPPSAPPAPEPPASELYAAAVAASAEVSPGDGICNNVCPFSKDGVRDAPPAITRRANARAHAQIYLSLSLSLSLRASRAREHQHTHASRVFVSALC